MSNRPVVFANAFLAAALFACAASLCLPTAAFAEPFPGYGILPKTETGALRFLEDHPEYDGRGVVVAIFDTGVDPGAPGLQTTSDGRPKIVEVVDGSGSGDVDTSTVRKAENREIAGLSGRTLRIAKQWKPQDGEFHVGIKRGYEIFPQRLVSRLKKKRREKWDAQQRKVEARVRRQLAAWKEKHPEPNEKQKKRGEELRARLELLSQLQKEYDDPGPVFDCVVFHDGEHWRAAVDTDEDGDLADEKLLANFRLEREYATFGKEDLLNFALNIYQDGDLLSIVTDCGAHGTHVAGIVAGHFPGEPELSGIAPGAQIVSVKIGDRRLGSNSTGTGETRGLITVLQNECDLINMSYGGSTADPNAGDKIELFSEIVDKHSVIFVASAGNGGPALSTVASPGGTTSAVLGVGAYVSPEMMEVGYSLRERLREIPYTWTSRGPAIDGDLGVDICAPGGAIAPVPNWVLQRNMLMNGTSMSSPNACGNIALLLSGLKQERIEYSPSTIRRALQNTARPVERGDAFAHGQGLIQVDAAWQQLSGKEDSPMDLLCYEITLPDRKGDRGIYLREPGETAAVLETDVRVTPHFPDATGNREKVQLELRLSLESTAPWIEVPEHLLLGHGGRSFAVRIDPERLPEGVNYGEVQAYDSRRRERGPLFRVPVTVAKPEPVAPPYRVAETIRSEPGDITRRFFAVPEGATWADVTLQAGDLQASRLVVLHARQVLPRRGYRRSDHRHFITLRPQEAAARAFPVAGGHTLEVCLAQYWSSLGEGEFEMVVEFHGLPPDDPDMHFGSGRLSGRVEVRAPLRDERLAPEAKLEVLRRALRPQKAELRPLPGPRDLLPERRRNHELILTYEFELGEEAEVTPRPAISEQDEARLSWQSHLWQIFDAGKQLLASGAGSRKVKLPEGKHVLRFHLRHYDPKRLSSLREMVLLLDRKLAEPIELEVYADPDHAVRGGEKFSERILPRGERAVLFLAVPNEKQTPEFAEPGDELRGTLTFGKEEASLAGAGRRPGGFAIRYQVGPQATGDEEEAGGGPAEKTAGNANKSEEDPSLEEKLLATKLSHLQRLREQNDREAFDPLAAEILQEKPDHLPVLVEQLKLLDRAETRKQWLPEIVAAADRIIDAVDTDRLAAHFGRRVDQDDPRAVEKHKEMERRKKILVDTLYRKGRALAYMDLPRKYSKPEERDMEIRKFPESEKERRKRFEANFRELQRWVDTTGKEYFLLHARRERRHGRPALALKLINRHLKDTPTRRLLYKKRGDLFDELGWNHWRDYQRKWMLLRFPEHYPPF